MYNIDIYTYTKKPFNREKKFTIHPLDDPGKEKYYSNNSHCHHYFKRTDPFVFKSIVGADYKALINEQDSGIKTARESHHPTLTETKNTNTTPHHEHSKNFSKYIEEKKCNDKKNTVNNFYPKISKKYLKNFSEKNLNNSNDRYFCNSQTNFRPYNRKKNFKGIYGY